jgi:hypothetical protein
MSVADFGRLGGMPENLVAQPPRLARRAAPRWVTFLGTTFNPRSIVLVVIKLNNQSQRKTESLPNESIIKDLTHC